MKTLFKNRNFMLLFNGALVSSIGDVLFNFAIGLYILDLTHSAFMLSLYGMVGGVTWLVISPFGGVWCDRLNRVKIIYLTDLIRGLTMFLCGFVMLSSDKTVEVMPVLFITAFIISVNGSLFGPASQAMVPMLVKKDELIHANALMSLMYNVKDVFGMLLAGVMFASIGPVAIVFINGISYVLSGVTEMFIKVEQIELKEREKQHVVKELLDGFKYILSANTGIVLILVLMNLKNLALGPVQSVLLPYLLNEQLGANEMDLSIIYMFSAIGGIMGSLIVSKGVQSENVYRTIKQSFMLLSVTLFAQLSAYLLFDNQVINYGFLFLVFSLSLLIAGVVGILFYIPMYTMLQKIVEPAYYGRVMGLFTMLSALTLPLSSMLGGVMIDVFGVVVLFGVCLVILLLSLLALMQFKSKLNQSVTSPKKIVVSS